MPGQELQLPFYLGVLLCQFTDCSNHSDIRLVWNFSHNCDNRHSDKSSRIWHSSTISELGSCRTGYGHSIQWTIYYTSTNHTCSKSAHKPGWVRRFYCDRYLFNRAVAWRRRTFSRRQNRNRSFDSPGCSGNPHRCIPPVSKKETEKVSPSSRHDRPRSS